MLSLADQSDVGSRRVVIATGVSYRRLDAQGLAPRHRRPLRCRGLGSASNGGTAVFIAGGANSAGQAAVNLACRISGR
jgi:thioredoxin reductase (NADPH)